MTRDNQKGETLLEVVVAVSVLMIVMGPASGAIVNSIRNTALNRDTAVASSLAKEGLEIVRNFRDSNVLRFSSNKEKCWNMKPDSASGDCDDPANKIGAGVYRLETDPITFQWTLNDTNAPLSEGLNNPTADTFFNLLLSGGDLNLYNHTSGTPTSFYRQIEISYLEFAEPPAGAPVSAQWLTGNDAMKVVSTVRFRNGTNPKPQKITMAEILTKPIP